MDQNIKDLVIPEMIRIMQKFDSNACELVLNSLKKRFNLSDEDFEHCKDIATKKWWIDEHGIEDWNKHVKDIKDNLHADIDVPIDEGFDFYTDYFINLDEGAKTEYLKYITGHINNVKKGYRWMKKNLPEIFVNQSKFKTNMTIAKHDLSKFNYKKEFKPYVDHFKGTPEQKAAGQMAFKQAWNHHQKINKHHWQYWVLVNYKGEHEVLDMPFENIVEMVCDWWSFSWKDHDLYSIFDWYNKNKNYMILSPKTRSTAEMILHKMKKKLDELKKDGKLNESIEFANDVYNQWFIYEEDELNDDPEDLNEEYIELNEVFLKKETTKTINDNTRTLFRYMFKGAGTDSRPIDLDRCDKYDLLVSFYDDKHEIFSLEKYLDKKSNFPKSKEKELRENINTLKKYVDEIKKLNKSSDEFRSAIIKLSQKVSALYNKFVKFDNALNEEFSILSLNESTYTTKAQKQYSDYLITHVSNTKKGYFFIKENCPEMLEGADTKQIEDNIIVHDESKYSNEEYNAYSNFFYGERTPEVKKAFQLAWEHHWTHNPHHPEYWHGSDMPLEYIIEMICDWWSFSWKDNDLSTIFDFWEKAKVDQHKKLSENTKIITQRLLNILHDTLVKKGLI